MPFPRPGFRRSRHIPAPGEARQGGKSHCGQRRAIQSNVIVACERSTMNKIILQSRRRGVAIVYVAVCMIATMGLLSLAVDLGRVETAKTELRRATDAAARAALAALPQG